LQPIRQRIDHGIKTGVNVAWRDVISPLKLAVSTPKLRELCIAAVGLTTLHQGFISFIIIYLTLELHLGLVAAGMILAASQITAIAGRLFWGWLGDRTHDAFLVLAIIILGASALYLGLAFYPHDLPIWPVAVISILLGGTVASWQGLFFAANARSAPPGKVVSAVGGVQFFLFVGGSGGPVVIATVVSLTHDYRIVYGLLALLAAWLGTRLLRLRRNGFATS
jgi:MFS family permease